MPSRRFVSLALSSISLAAVACSSATSSDHEPVGQSQQAVTSAGNPTCRSVTLHAEKDYAPQVHYQDGSATASPAMRFDVPWSIPTSAGKPGHGSLTLTLHDGSRTTVCKYHGDDGCDGHGWGLGKGRYHLDYCSHQWSDDATASSFLLHVAEGDEKDAAGKTVVDLTLNEEGHCSPPPPPVDAGPPVDAAPPPPVDAGPTLGSCTSAAQCDDGNFCTTDACTANACTHTAAANGTACDDGNSCTTGDACTAGACAGTSAADGTKCDDSLGCTSGGTCSAGKCTGSTVVADGTACGTADGCVFSSGATCSAGVCAGTPDCGGAECVSSACNGNTGACMPSPAGTPCSTGVCDGNFQCVAGTPAANVSSVAPLCPTQNGSECNAATGSYVTASNGCSYAALAAGTTCSTGVCDGSGNCVASATGPGTGAPLVLGAGCPANGACTSPGSIDFATGGCVYVDLVSGTPCGSGGHCDGAGKCGP